MTTQPWRYGENFGGRTRAQWEADPEGLAQYILRTQTPNMSQASREWNLDQIRRQTSLWNAYRAAYAGPGQPPAPIGVRTDQPLGDWLLAAITGGTNNPAAPGGEAGMQGLMGDVGNRLRRNTQDDPGWYARNYRSSVNAGTNPFNNPLEVMLAAYGVSGAVRDYMARNVYDYRQQYTGMGEAGPQQYYEWLMRRLNR